MRRGASGVLVVSLVAWGACGGLVRFDGQGDDDGAGGATNQVGPGPTSVAVTTGVGGGGEGGGLVCGELTFAGDPVRVEVPAGGPLAGLRLIRVSATRWALAFEAHDSNGRLVMSLAIDDPFGSWPPVASPVDANFPASQPFATGEGEPGHFGFAATDAFAPGVALGRAEPGGNGSTFFSWSAPIEPVHFMARNAIGSYLVGRGFAPSGIFVDLVSDFSSTADIQTLGPLGCAGTEIVGEAVASGSAWLVATSAHEPHLPCSNDGPPGNPVAVQLLRIANQEPIATSAFVQSSPVQNLRLVNRPGGAWLSVERQNAQIELHRVDADGYADDPSWTWVSAGLDGHALATVARGYALAFTELSLVPSVNLAVVPDADDFAVGYAMTSTLEVGLQGRGAPAIAAEGGSVLLATIDDEAASPTVAIVRADCGFVGGGGR